MDILFWSGGKDSYLALEFYQRDYDSNTLKLLTTYEKGSETVPHQNIAVDFIKEQAKKLGLEHLLVPLPKDCSNKDYLDILRDVFNKEQEPVKRLVFGDWKLEDIRSWRETVFGEMGYSCLFPIWQKSLNDLLPVLLFKAVTVEISAVRKEYQPYLRVGEEYNQRLVRQLPQEIDPMGENGEFHTRVVIQDPDKQRVV